MPQLLGRRRLQPPPTDWYLFKTKSQPAQTTPPAPRPAPSRSPAVPRRARSGSRSRAASPLLLSSPASHAPRFTPASPAASWSHPPCAQPRSRAPTGAPWPFPGEGARPSTRSHPARPSPRTSQAPLSQRSLRMGRKENWPRFCTSFLSKLKGYSSSAACRGFLLPAASRPVPRARPAGAPGKPKPRRRGWCRPGEDSALPTPSRCRSSFQPLRPLPGAALAPSRASPQPWALGDSSSQSEQALGGQRSHGSGRGGFLEDFIWKATQKDFAV